MIYMGDNNVFEPTAYSRWIDDFLTANGLTSYKLAPLSGVSQPTIDRIRSGQSQYPSRATIQKLEKVITTPSPDSAGQVEESRPPYAALPPNAAFVLNDLRKLAENSALSDTDLLLIHALAKRIARVDDTYRPPAVLDVERTRRAAKNNPQNSKAKSGQGGPVNP